MNADEIFFDIFRFIMYDISKRGMFWKIALNGVLKYLLSTNCF